MLKTTAGTAGLLGYITFLIILTGYTYIVSHPIKSKISTYQNGSQYYISLLVHGIIFIVIAELTFSPIKDYFSSNYSNFYHLTVGFLKEIFVGNWLVFKYAIEAIWPLSIALIFSQYRRWVYWFTNRTSGSNVIGTFGTDLQKLFNEIIEEYTVSNTNIANFPLVEIVLRNNKVYIGAPHTCSPPNVHAKQEYCVLLPFRSGYRDPEKEFDLVLNHNYWKLFYKKYSESNLEGYKVLLNIDDIVMVRPFSIKKYDKLQAEKAIVEVRKMLKNDTLDAQTRAELESIKLQYINRINNEKALKDMVGPLPLDAKKISFRKFTSLTLKDAANRFPGWVHRNILSKIKFAFEKS